MREIKFRGILLEDSKSFKTYKKGTIIYGGFYKEVDNYFIVAHKNIFKIDPKTVGQFTGLTDKNGNDIYEGDIVTYIKKKIICDCKDENDLVYDYAKFCSSCGKETKAEDFKVVCEVKFYNGAFCLYSKHGDDRFSAWPANIAEIYIIDKEVIGNIHENSELL